jgi:hypothetical protein
MHPEHFSRLQLTSLGLPKRIPVLPGNILNVSPIHASAILQSTNELKRTFSAGISLKDGSGLLLLRQEITTARPMTKKI